MTDQTKIDADVLGLDGHALDTLLPMHVTFSGDGRVRRVGPTFRKLFGEAEPVGRPLFEVIKLRRLDDVASSDTILALAGQRLSLIISSLPDLPMRGQCVPFGDGDGGLLDISLGLSFAEAVELRGLTMSDFSPCDHTVDLLYLREANLAVSAESTRVTDRLVSAERAANFRASTDELTGLANRRTLSAVLDRLVTVSDFPFAIMQLDLDNFKEINDQHGHHAGDIVLCQVGKVLNGVVRKRDVAARMGGDEFVLLIRDDDSETALNGIANRIIQRLREPIEIDGKKFSISTSIGTTRSSLYAQPDADQMLRDADEALYASKRQGRGRNCFYSPPGADARTLP